MSTTLGNTADKDTNHELISSFIIEEKLGKFTFSSNQNNEQNTENQCLVEFPNQALGSPAKNLLEESGNLEIQATALCSHGENSLDQSNNYEPNLDTDGDNPDYELSVEDDFDDYDELLDGNFSGYGYKVYDSPLNNVSFHKKWDTFGNRVRKDGIQKNKRKRRVEQNETGSPEEMIDRAHHLFPLLTNTSKPSSGDTSDTRGLVGWRKWAALYDLEPQDILPANPFHVSIYLTLLAQSNDSPQPVIDAFNSFKKHHDLLKLESPTDSPSVKNILDSAKSRLDKSTDKKSISIDVLSAMYKNTFIERDMKRQRIIVALLLAYAGFLRSDVLLKVKLRDVVIEKSHMRIFIESCRVDSSREGSWIIIARTGTKLCPVANLELYLKWANFIRKGDEFLLYTNTNERNIYNRASYVRKVENKAMSYSQLKHSFANVLLPFVKNISDYCMNNLRGEQASIRYNNNGIKDRLYQKNGRWISEHYGNVYFKRGNLNFV